MNKKNKITFLFLEIQTNIVNKIHTIPNKVQKAMQH